MLLKHRAPGIESPPASPPVGLEHLDPSWIAILRWLQANRVEFVLIGEVASAIRGDAGAKGPVRIVPAPYGRNHERLTRALLSARARLRVDGEADTTPVKLDAAKLARGSRWMFRCGVHDFDVQGRVKGAPRYQELLYEASRFELAPDISVEVASPEDVEHYAHLRRTGAAPQIKITRGSTVSP